MAPVKTQSGKKRTYETPVLRVFGSVQAMTRGTGGMGADGAMGMTMMSDPRAKQNIAGIGRHPQGFGLYLFEYKPAFATIHGAGRRFGVMADEVERLVPGAVVRDVDGLMRVDYRKLGIRSGN